ncbi:hypothetical protein NDU88_001368 [Pleurodeles waltl]|uniref:Uncharacterized protein n=1 Tax=Pleurodeles waltl TaxID=8319 RepID=A0AAV7UUJ4_PLEWA|nr:hypothetical protein NDU88_001368 [Pleurodeles waltl]
MDRILQEISAVGRKLEGMDSAMALLTAETKSMRLNIVGFQVRDDVLSDVVVLDPVAGSDDGVQHGSCIVGVINDELSEYDVIHAIEEAGGGGLVEVIEVEIQMSREDVVLGVNG